MNPSYHLSKTSLMIQIPLPLLRQLAENSEENFIVKDIDKLGQYVGEQLTDFTFPDEGLSYLLRETVKEAYEFTTDCLYLIDDEDE